MDWGSVLGGSGASKQPFPDVALIFFKSSLPEDAKMVCLEIYADKTQLSSFGTEKGYPVMARIVNLPTKIRHGEGIGGGRVVGWLPIVSIFSGKGKTDDLHRKRLTTVQRTRVGPHGSILNELFGTQPSTSC